MFLYMYTVSIHGRSFSFILSTCTIFLCIHLYTLQILVDQDRNIMGVTVGFPGTYSDKTVMNFDEAMARLRSKEYQRHFYDLYRSDGSTFQCKGVFVLSDNGYNKWSSVIMPSKYPKSDKEVCAYVHMCISALFTHPPFSVYMLLAGTVQQHGRKLEERRGMHVRYPERVL